MGGHIRQRRYPVLAGMIRLARALLFRRGAWRELIADRIPLTAAILLAVSLMIIQVTSVLRHAVDPLFSLAALIASFVYLLCNGLALVEPALNMVLKASTADEPSLHWWNAGRSRGRSGVILVLALSTVTFMAGYVVLGLLAGTVLAAIMVMVGLVALLAFGWNYRVTEALALAAAPFSLAGAAAVALIEPWAALTLFLIALAALPFALNDVWRARGARKAVAELIASARLDAGAVLDIVTECRLSGDATAARRLLVEFHHGVFRAVARPAWLDVRVLSAAGMYVEAIDRGLLALDTEADASLHLAMAEAALAARDPENAAAHAEEALEEIGDSALSLAGNEALLLLALASFNNEEVESGVRACERLLAQPPTADRRRANLQAEARALVRRFGREMVTEEV